MSTLTKLFLCGAILLLLASSPIQAEDPQYGPFGTEDPFGSPDPFGDPHNLGYDLYGGPMHEDDAIIDSYQGMEHHYRGQ